MDCSGLGSLVSGKPQELVGLRAERREVCSCGILSSSLSKEGRGKGFLESGVYAGLLAGYGSPCRGLCGQ